MQTVHALGPALPLLPGLASGITALVGHREWYIRRPAIHAAEALGEGALTEPALLTRMLDILKSEPTSASEPLLRYDVVVWLCKVGWRAVGGGDQAGIPWLYDWIRTALLSADASHQSCAREVLHSLGPHIASMGSSSSLSPSLLHHLATDPSPTLRATAATVAASVGVSGLAHAFLRLWVDTEAQCSPLTEPVCAQMLRVLSCLGQGVTDRPKLMTALTTALQSIPSPPSPSTPLLHCMALRTLAACGPSVLQFNEPVAFLRTCLESSSDQVHTAAVTTLRSLFGSMSGPMPVPSDVFTPSVIHVLASVAAACVCPDNPSIIMAYTPAGTAELTLHSGSVPLVSFPPPPPPSLSTICHVSTLLDPASAVVSDLTAVGMHTMFSLQQCVSLCSAVEAHLFTELVILSFFHAIAAGCEASDSNRRAFLRCGAVGLAVKGLSVHAGSPCVQCAGLRALEVLHAGTQSLAVPDSVMDRLAVAMDAHLGVESVQLSGCGLISCLASDEGNKIRLARQGTLERLCAAMASHRSSSGVQGRACTAIAFLTTNDDNCGLAMLAGVLPHVTLALQTHSHDPDVVCDASDVLYNLAYKNPVATGMIVGLGVLPLLSSARIEFKDNEPVFNSICGALELLS